MTTEIAIRILKSHMEHDRLDTPTYHALGYAITELETTCKTDNRPSDARSTTAWMDIPESPNEENFRANVDESLTELNREIMQCETDIQMLWDAVEAIRERLPREWGR